MGILPPGTLSQPKTELKLSKQDSEEDSLLWHLALDSASPPFKALSGRMLGALPGSGLPSAA